MHRAAEHVLDDAVGGLRTERAVALHGQRRRVVGAGLRQVGEPGQRRAELLLVQRGVEDLGERLHGLGRVGRVAGHLVQRGLHHLPETGELRGLRLSGRLVGGVRDGGLAAEVLLRALLHQHRVLVLAGALHGGVRVHEDVAERVDQQLQVRRVEPPTALDVGAEQRVEGVPGGADAVRPPTCRGWWRSRRRRSPGGSWGAGRSCRASWSGCRPAARWSWARRRPAAGAPRSRPASGRHPRRPCRRRRS